MHDGMCHLQNGSVPGGRGGRLRVNLPAQQEDMTTARGLAEAQRQLRVMLPPEISQQATSSHDHCPCSKCQVISRFFPHFYIFTPQYITLYFLRLFSHSPSYVGPTPKKIALNETPLSQVDKTKPFLRSGYSLAS
jgi:hypothetical protein